MDKFWAKKKLTPKTHKMPQFIQNNKKNLFQFSHKLLQLNCHKRPKTNSKSSTPFDIHKSTSRASAFVTEKRLSLYLSFYDYIVSIRL